MKRIAIGIVAGAALIGTHALAADMPVKAPPLAAPAWSWTGFYIGANGGYAWGNPAGSLVPDYSSIDGIPQAVAGGFYPSNLGVRQSGAFGGGEIGYNWQLNEPWVVGLETDVQGSGITGTNTVVFPGGGIYFPSTTTTSDKLQWFGTTRVRAGWLTSPTFLLYATAGAAYGTEQITSNFISTAGTTFLTGSTNDTRIGWSAGAGFEWKVTGNVSFKAEYLHIDLGYTTLRMNSLNPALFFDYRFHDAYDLVRVGVNYQFDSMASPWK